MSASNRPMVVGMVGVGGYGSVRRNRMRASGLFKLAAAFDRNPAALEAAQKQDGARPCASVDELLATEGLEGLVISTGADSHAPLAIAAMKAGLHVFVEKPLCTSVEEVRELRRVQQETGRVVAVGHTHHDGDAAIRTVRQLVSEDRLGTLACYEENSSHSGGLLIKPGDWRGLADRNPGGMLFHCGVHSLHRLCHLFGPIESLQAMMRFDANPNTETADVASVLLRHRSGMVGTLNCYHVTAYCHEFRLFGTKGTLGIDTHTQTGWFQVRKAGEVETRDPIELAAGPGNEGLLEVTSWYQAVRGGGEASPSLEDGVNAVLPVFAAELADREGRRVRLEELAPELAAVG